MKKNEVRVGNLVSVNGSDYLCYITKIDIAHATVSRDGEVYILASWTDLYGVPVTEEIIKDLGWINLKEGEEGKMPFGIGHGLTDNNFYAILGDFYILIEFVHELQNVYFMVEKEELDVSKLLK